MFVNDECYRGLIAGIFKLAAKDVLTLPKEDRDRRSAERFLKSGWFIDLSEFLGLNPERFMDLLSEKQKSIEDGGGCCG